MSVNMHIVRNSDIQILINGSENTDINADGSTTTITTTIKDDGTVIIDRVTTKP